MHKIDIQQLKLDWDECRNLTQLEKIYSCSRKTLARRLNGIGIDTNKRLYPIIEGKKECRECGNTLTIDNFHSIKVTICRKCIKKYNKQYQCNNRSHINASRKQRYINDTGYRIECNIRSRLCNVLAGKNKSASTKELLGCTIDELKTHLQSTAIINGYKDFDINSYLGHEYHIDHIRPCSSFNLKDEEEQRQCFNWSNLQILSAKENFKKGNKLTGQNL